MEDYGKLFTYIGRHTKTIRNSWIKKVETFSDRTDLFHITVLKKTEENHGKNIKMEDITGDFKDKLIDIQNYQKQLGKQGGDIF